MIDVGNDLPSFDDFTLNEVVTEDIKERKESDITNIENELPNFDNLDLSETIDKNSSKLVIPVDADIEKLEIIDDNNFQLPAEFLEADFGEPIIAKTEETARELRLLDEELSIVNQETENKLTILNGIDINQETLDLAKNYLDSGEYDSARRLLSEVIEIGTEAQQTEAKSLLARVG
ncbi:MAG: hypothetical protein KGV51_05270 [Moraxellaceae bacterium]|nr:hypothetical protein [Moraxellaceae bacterium]